MTIRRDMTHLHYDRAGDTLLCGVMTSGLARQTTAHSGISGWVSTTTGAVAGWELQDFHRSLRAEHPELWLLWLKYHGAHAETLRRVLAEHMGDAIGAVVAASEHERREQRLAMALAV
jgi:hypothetical protein